MQEELAIAAGKLAECQKTIASLGKQLKSLATLEDFLTDAGNLRDKCVSHIDKQHTPSRRKVVIQQAIMQRISISSISTHKLRKTIINKMTIQQE